jgi:hypothetical protein
MNKDSGLSQIQIAYFPERRSGNDRRAKPTSPFSWSSISGSRKHIRRAEDREKHRFVDVYSPGFLLVILIVLSFSLLDAYLTLHLINQGAQELNPVMAFFLEFGHMPFLLVKYFLTAFGLVALLILKNCTLWGGRISARVVLLTIPFLYGLLIAYELFLISKVTS